MGQVYSEEVEEAVAAYKKDFQGFNVAVWSDASRNIALSNKYKDVALFEWEDGEAYFGHYFFRSGGAKATKAANEFLKEMFEKRGAKIIKGLTPVDNIGARQLNKRLGFQDCGTLLNLPGGDYVVVQMTLSDWINK